jgi:hypothetical protein
MIGTQLCMHDSIYHIFIFVLHARILETCMRMQTVHNITELRVQIDASMVCRLFSRTLTTLYRLVVYIIAHILKFMCNLYEVRFLC